MYDSVIQFSDIIKILGATLDSSLHFKATSKSCFYLCCRQICSSVDHIMAISIASTLV